jgi:uncharacterized protein YhaN
MKILDLHFFAFGPFTELRLDLAAGGQGLHMVFAPNEAGKSSALRGLKALLYGIPRNASDNFQHDNSKLRIGGRICHSDGSEFSFIRRKGLKNTLLSPDGNPLPDSALSQFLARVSENLFSTMFGIDHQTLVEGGQEILRGGGDVGQSLFTAGLGGISVRQILQDLENEAGQLFRPRGQNYTINKAVADFVATRRAITELSVSSRAWAEHDRALQDATAERHKVREEIECLSRRQHHLERLQGALAKIASRKALLAKLAQLGDVVILSSDFPDRRREVMQRLETATEVARAVEPALHRLQQDLQALAVPESLLGQQDTIATLHERLGGYRKAAHDRSWLRARRLQLEGDAQVLLARLRPGLPLEEAREQARLEIQAAEEQAQVGLKQLGLSSGTLEEVEVLPIPPKQTLDRFETEFSSLDSNKTRLEEQLGTLQSELRELDRTLDELRLAGPVPSEDELLQARAQRDRLWKRLRHARIDREGVPDEIPVLDTRENLPEVYEQSVSHADEVADRLRREADRVARQATLIARRTKCTRDVEQLAADKATLQGQIDHLHQAWNRGWQAIGVTPLAPRDMRAWVDKHEQLRRRAESMREYHRQFNRLHDRIEEHRSELYQSLARLSDEAVPAHATLDALLAHSEALIETIEEVGRQRHDLQTQVSRLQQELQGAQHEQRKATDQLAQWRTDWTAAVADLGLGGEAVPAEANAVLSTRDELLKKLSEISRSLWESALRANASVLRA